MSEQPPEPSDLKPRSQQSAAKPHFPTSAFSLQPLAFSTVSTEGTLLPSDFLQRLAQHDREVPGLTADAYHLGSGERINEAISRSWNRLLAVWKSFTVSVAQLPDTDPGDKLTREKWLLPFFQELGYGRLSTSKPFEFDGRRYAISHIWQNTPIHLFSFRADLDTRSENIIGARTSSPHSMVQEFLNRSEGHLWGIVCNGYRLRLLRDNASLTRQAYVEFDLQSMMQGEVYADFALLWLLLHQSRVEGERPELCWLEKWTQEARQRGARVLDQLRDGVEESITALGSGFLAHPANAALRDKLNTGALTKQDYFRQLLRIVYRFLFLFVAEDRELLFTEQVPIKIREQYLRHYSLTRLRRMALRLGGTQHADLWHVVRLVFQALGSEKGCPALGLPALGSFLWSDKATPDLNDCQIANRELLQAIRALAFAEQKNVRRPIDYKNIGTEELGSVYESLLEQHPDVHVATAKFTLGTHAGHERKTTGSYYTPPSLVQCLLDSALEPVVAEACKKPNPEQAILALKVCDKACGSGHFLIAAAHRIARRLAAVRTGEDEPGPVALRHALRDVIGHCIYGVDINPMAVELCKFALWLEAVEPGKPLSFLDHHIQCGNSLIGATPALMQQGIPDKAFEPIEGDDRKYCAQFKKANKDEAEQMQLFSHDNRPWEHLGNLAVNVAQLASLPDDTVSDVQTKERRYAELVRSSAYESGRQLADAWCAAFVWIKRKPANSDQRAANGVDTSALPDGFPFPITNDIYRRLERNPRDCPPWMRDEIRRLVNQYQFFHWHLAFPEVFQVPTKGKSENDLCGWNGGFDIMLGNPPWERIKLQEKEWFAERRPEIANAANAAARKLLIETLLISDPVLYRTFVDDSRQAEGESQLLRNTGIYPLCGRGDINVYAVFAEGMRNHLSLAGRLGCVLPSGIATDDTTKFFFQDVIEKSSLTSFFDFQSGGDLFADIGHARFKFCLLTLTGAEGGLVGSFDCCFFLRDTTDLGDNERRFTLSADEIRLLNPNTHTCPIFRTRRDAEITKGIYRHIPVFLDESSQEASPWRVKFSRMFDMSNDSHSFQSKEELMNGGWNLAGNVFNRGNERYLPLYEAKMMHQFEHRFGDYSEKPEDSESTALPDVSIANLTNPLFSILPRYWLADSAVMSTTAGKKSCRWFPVYRRIARTGDFRTMISAILPFVAIADKAPVILSPESPSNIACLVASLNAFVCDYAVRQKVGGTQLDYHYVYQLPVLPPSIYAQSCDWTGKRQTLQGWVLARVLELTYTAWDLEPFAQDCGYDGPPFKWDEDRRFLLRCELDAAFFHLYGITRDDTAYIMDTFPIVKRKDEAKWGTYRTKDTILEIYDALAAATQSGQPYVSRLPIPPASILATHEPRWPDGVRPKLDALTYFQIVLPLMLRFNPGIDLPRLIQAFAVLTDSKVRKEAAGETAFMQKWIKECPSGLDFSDAAGVLIALLQDGTIEGVTNYRLAEGSDAPNKNAWLDMDAFVAVRLAMESPVKAVQQTQQKHSEWVCKITRKAA